MTPRAVDSQAQIIRTATRSVSAAVSVDVFGDGKAQAAADLGQDSRDFNKSLREGRELFRHLGAWPWAHSAVVGDIDSDWWTIARYRTPFRAALVAARSERAQRLQRVDEALRLI